jgi:endonuclease/exonuclease/phosphatase family metal-dependent hydrolase
MKHGVTVIASIITVVLIFAAVFFFRRDNRNGAANDAGAGGKAATAKIDKKTAVPLPDTVTAAFYNVENLFDFNLDGTEYDEYKPEWHGWSAEMQRKKLQCIAEVIAAVGADVIGLCETENKGALTELATALDKLGTAYPYSAVAEAAGSATVTALLSKFPVVYTSSHPVDGSRPILEATVARGGDTLRFFANHWPSKRHPESTRAAAAQTLRKRLDELPRDADYIIMGDFNSRHDEYAVFHSTGHDDTGGETGINHVLKTITDGGRPDAPARFVCKGELPACNGCHYNPWLEVEETARFSYIYRGAKETIDNMLLPPALFDSAGYSYLDGSFHPFTWDGRLMKDGAPYRWQMYYKGKQKYHKGGGYSDHLPITAKFAKTKSLPPTGSAAENCAASDPSAKTGDFAVSTDGWVSADSRFSVERDGKHAKTGTHSLRVSGLHESENRTAARAVLTSTQRQKTLTMSIFGEGKPSIRLRRPDGKWTYHNAPEFTSSKNAKYNEWKSTRWVNIKLPLPPSDGVNNTDVEVELRAGKGEKFLMWIDRVRLE